MSAVISARGLRKSYGSVEAVRGVDLDVHQGEVVAFLGPNGAGKTTTVEILEGYRPRSGGEVEVLGADPGRSTPAWRARIGVVLQTCQVWSLLSVRESLELHAGYYPHPRSVDETVALAGLSEQADQRAGKLSGGQQRRLDVAMALIGDPELLFLDEPTTGFDPAARRSAWEVVDGLRQLGKTVFLTTHYMDEAQNLADRVAIIVDGRIVAEGPPSSLVGAATETSVRFVLPAGAAELPTEVAAIANPVGDMVSLRTEDPLKVLHSLTGWALEHDVAIRELSVSQPSLEDVYLSLTSRQESSS